MDRGLRQSCWMVSRWLSGADASMGRWWHAPPGCCGRRSRRRMRGARDELRGHRDVQPPLVRCDPTPVVKTKLRVRSRVPRLVHYASLTIALAGREDLLAGGGELRAEAFGLARDVGEVPGARGVAD